METALHATARRTRQRSIDHQVDVDLSSGAVMAIITHVDTRLGETESRIMAVITEGREAHTREHSEQQLTCQHSMDPLQRDLAARVLSGQRRDARVRPLVGGAEWVTNHWAASLGIGAAVIWALVRAGVIHP